jgi:predicted lipid-binding transport protein (Tim44 family)
MIGLLVMAVVVVVGLIMRRRAGAHPPAMAGAGAMQYAATGSTPAATAPQGYDVVRPRPGSDAGASASTTHEAPVAAAGIPADFDVVGFERQAKVSFIRLQAANDAANLDDLREFTTPEMFAELKANILERGDVPQKTEVLEINAEVLEVVEESSRYVISVRFSGLIREESDAPAESISEIWHLVKPRLTNGGWLLAGIQQTQ